MYAQLALLKSAYDYILTDFRPLCMYFTSMEMKQLNCKKFSLVTVEGSSGSSSELILTSKVPPKNWSINELKLEYPINIFEKKHKDCVHTLTCAFSGQYSRVPGLLAAAFAATFSGSPPSTHWRPAACMCHFRQSGQIAVMPGAMPAAAQLASRWCPSPFEQI